MSMFLKKAALSICLLLSACNSQINSETMPSTTLVSPTLGLAIVGGVEPVYVLPLKTPFAARIDTGAETSSIDVVNLTPFERDGEKWVAFTLTNAQNGESKRFEKRVVRRTIIRRAAKDERRYVVILDIKIGNEVINAEFTLADREKFEYQGLIGRNVINGRFLVDSSLDNTLH